VPPDRQPVGRDAIEDVVRGGGGEGTGNREAAIDAGQRGDLLSAPSLLWPHPAQATICRSDHPADGEQLAEFIVIPNATQPRLLVPASPRRAAAAAVRRYSDGVSRRDQFTRQMLSFALRTGIAHLSVRDRVVITQPAGLPHATESIEDYLSDLLGHKLVVSLGVGPLRANRKPVLQLLAPSGATLGYAKVGHNSLTRQLVRDEADALRQLSAAPLAKTSVPSVLHSGQWRGLEVLVLSALPTGSPRRRRDKPPLQAMHEIAGLDAENVSPLGESAFWSRTLTRLHEVRPAVDPPLNEVVKQIEKWAETPVRLGAWHGDWTPWNMSWQGDTVLLWDWERFGHDVPVGFDPLHFRIQSLLRAHGPGERTKAGVEFAGQARTLLHDFGVPAEQSQLITVLYLLSIYLRYAGDARGEAGEHLRPLSAWVLSQLVDHGRRL
jgi:hypothetical protein